MNDNAKQSLIAAANLFLLQGIFAVIVVAVSLFNGKINLNYNLIGLLIAPGLYKLSESWRGRALTITVIELFVLPIAVLIYLFAPDSVLFMGRKAGPYVPLLLLAAVAWFFVDLWRYKILSAPAVKQICR
jgi:hypothetical protein